MQPWLIGWLIACSHGLWSNASMTRKKVAHSCRPTAQAKGTFAQSVIGCISATEYKNKNLKQFVLFYLATHCELFHIQQFYTAQRRKWINDHSFLVRHDIVNPAKLPSFLIRKQTVRASKLKVSDSGAIYQTNPQKLKDQFWYCLQPKCHYSLYI